MIATVAVARCPVCDGDATQPMFDDLTDRVFGVAPGRWRLVRCGTCGLGRLDPRPSDDAIGELYARYYTHGAPEPNLVPPSGLGRALRALRNAHVNATLGYALRPSWRAGVVAGRALGPLAAIAERGVRSLPAGRRVLDVGCGNGEWVAEARAAGWAAEGIDLDEAAVAAGRAAGLALSVETVEQRAEREPGALDAVTLSHVIEHLPDPVATLRAVHSLLAPGGHVWIATPNLGSLGARRYGRDWLHLDPPRHLVLFDHASLERALHRAGFVAIRRLRPTPVAIPAFAVSEAVRAGVVPANDAPRVTAAVRVRGALADLRASRDPALGEELLVLARRGG